MDCDVGHPVATLVLTAASYANHRWPDVHVDQSHTELRHRQLTHTHRLQHTNYTLHTCNIYQCDAVNHQAHVTKLTIL